MDDFIERIKYIGQLTKVEEEPAPVKCPKCGTSYQPILPTETDQ